MRFSAALRDASAGGGRGIRTVQKLLGHDRVETANRLRDAARATQIYTHAMTRPRLGVRSPLNVGSRGTNAEARTAP